MGKGLHILIFLGKRIPMEYYIEKLSPRGC